jgi:hypothetical protein
MQSVFQSYVDNFFILYFKSFELHVKGSLYFLKSIKTVVQLQAKCLVQDTYAPIPVI